MDGPLVFLRQDLAYLFACLFSSKQDACKHKKEMGTCNFRFAPMFRKAMEHKKAIGGRNHEYSASKHLFSKILRWTLGNNYT